MPTRILRDTLEDGIFEKKSSRSISALDIWLSHVVCVADT